MKLEKLAVPETGLVLDYVTINTGQSGYTFQGDTTYYISGALSLSGTTTFEGGAVLKYATNASLNFYTGAQLQWLATAYRPAVLTAKDDNSVGQSISGSTGNPTNYYANPALGFNGFSPALPIANFRIACAQQAISLNGGPSLGTFYDGQLVNCANGIYVGYSDANLRNMLFVNDLTSLTLNDASVDAQNVTFGNTNGFGGVLISGQVAQWNAHFTNCIFANLSWFVTGTSSPGNPTGGNNGFYNNSDPSGPTFGSSVPNPTSYPFQSKGAGNFYLAYNCAFTNAGTPYIDSTLLASLAQRTVYPPLVVSNVTFSTPTNWAPISQRGNGVTPDLGYHYDPLDYLVSQITETGQSLLLTNGVAVGLFGTAGFSVGNSSGSGLRSSGLANAMNHIVWYPSVQEEPVLLNGVSTASRAVFDLTGSGTPKIITLNFTDLPMQGSRQLLFNNPTTFDFPVITVQNCWLRGVNFGINNYQASGYTGPAAILQNNLLERSTVSLYNGYYYQGSYLQNPLAVTLYNNLFWQSSLSLSYYDQYATYHPAWTIKDNLFDTASFGFGGDGSYASYIGIANDGFYNTSNPLGGSNHVTVTNLTYTTGPFGPWYVNSNSPTLVDKGSQAANTLGLCHFIIQTNELPETNSIVDIGFHYVATDTNGVPLDSNGDGIPDYLEDGNGDCQCDNGETDWQATNAASVFLDHLHK
jgi:hypothetical protein